MPFTQKILGRTLLADFSGNLSASEFLLTIESFATLPEFDQLQFVINDFSRVKEHDLCNPVIEPATYAISSSAKMTNPNIQVLAVSTDAGIAKAVRENNAKNDGDGYPVKLFNTLGEAWAWIEQQSNISRPEIHRG